jgi:hypothetical protein
MGDPNAGQGLSRCARERWERDGKARAAAAEAAREAEARTKVSDAMARIYQATTPNVTPAPAEPEPITEEVILLMQARLLSTNLNGDGSVSSVIEGTTEDGKVIHIRQRIENGWTVE